MSQDNAPFRNGGRQDPSYNKGRIPFINPAPNTGVNFNYQSYESEFGRANLNAQQPAIPGYLQIPASS